MTCLNRHHLPMQRLSRPKLHELLARDLAVEIVGGQIAEGEAISAEPVLVEQTGVSKPVVRAAIQDLAAAGLVRIRHGARTVVTPEAEWNVLSRRVQSAFDAAGRSGEIVRDLHAVRGAIEPHAAAWCAEHAGDDDRRAIQAALSRMADVGAEDDAVTAFLERDQEFHAAIALGSKNLMLVALMRSIRAVVMGTSYMSGVDRNDLESLYAQHEVIAAAILSRKAQAAYDAMDTHLVWARGRDLAVFDGVDGTERSSAPDAVS
jgi:GntR family galactonate operon transcriptional repressor